MRILHCIFSLNPEGGGPADFVRQSMMLQSRYSVEIHCATFDRSGDPWITKSPEPIHALGAPFSRHAIGWMLQNVVSYDLVVVNGIWNVMSVLAATCAIRSKVPYVVFPHGMLDPWFAQYKLKHVKKTLYWWLIEHHVLRNARAVLFTSAEEQQRATNAFYPYKVNAMVVPYGTLAPPEVEPDPVLLESLRDKKFLLFMSRIHEKKGVDLLIKAFCKLCAPDLWLVIAGPCKEAYKLQLMQLATGPAAQRIIWTGMVSGQSKWSLLARAEALVLPSHQENFARIVSEALSCSTPVLISNKVNIFRTIEENRAGLVESDDQQGVDLMLTRWMNLPQEQRNSIRALSLACFEKHFDAGRNFPAYLSILESLCPG